METTKTSQLMKYLALDFVHNKNFNISILQLLCVQQKIHASTIHEQIQTKISIIDKGLQLLKQNHLKKEKQHKKKQIGYESLLQRNFYNMINILFFNISAINEHYINEIEKQMAESTASQSETADLNKTFYKDKMAINLLREHLRTYFFLLTEKSQFFKTLVSDLAQNGNRKITESELGLLQTLDYLFVKYSVSNELTEQIVEILEKNENEIEETSSQLISSNVIKEINKILFSSEKQSELYQILEMNSNVNFKNILTIINANYLNTNPPRKIFNIAESSGKQTIEGIIIRLIKRIGKNELFNEKAEDYTPFRLLLFHFLNKHFSVYMEFNQLIKGLMINLPLNNEVKLIILKKIERIFRILISIENALLHQIIQFIYHQLSTKYSEPIAFQLIKKLLLNRFLLNPSFYVIYNDPHQEEIKQYVQAANTVRALFYPSKAEELAQKHNCPQLFKISSQILSSLEYCLKKEKDTKGLIENNSNFLYVNDKILKWKMQQFYDEVKESFHPSKQAAKQKINLPNLVSDYSLSFSLVKNDHSTRNHLSHPVIENVSEVKFAINTNRSNINVKDNKSIRYMYEQLKGQKSQNEITPRSPEKNIKINTKMENKQEKKTEQNHFGYVRVSQLARKQHQISHETRLDSMKLPTDREMIEELVEMRKQFGERKKCLKKQYDERKSKRVKKMAFLEVFSGQFNHFKEQIERENNLLYIHMTTIA